MAIVFLHCFMSEKRNKRATGCAYLLFRLINLKRRPSTKSSGPATPLHRRMRNFRVFDMLPVLRLRRRMLVLGGLGSLTLPPPIFTTLLPVLVTLLLGDAWRLLRSRCRVLALDIPFPGTQVEV